VIHETGGWCLDVNEAEIAIAKRAWRGGSGLRAGLAVTLRGSKNCARRERLSRRDVVLLLPGTL